MIDGSDEPWISNPGEKRVMIHLYTAKPSTINKIRIDFKYKPKKFELFFVKKGGKLESFMV
jgi:hypothetical protein